jgi:superfamily II DNA helicase RecQ
VLDAIFARLGGEPLAKEALQRQVRVDEDTFDKALEKLWIHGGAVVDYAENVSRGHEQWRDSYIAQGEHKRAQIDLVIRYAAGNHCRMSALVRHFGDLTDSRQACGICDFCAPAQCEAQRFRSATPREREALLRVAGALGDGGSKTTGRLHAELYPDGGMTRDEFEDVLGAMARAGLACITDAVFEKDGRQIPYRKVSLTRDGAGIDEASAVDFVMKSAIQATRRRARKKKVAAPRRKRGQKTPAVAAPAPAAGAKAQAESGSKVEEALRQWRLAEARRRGVPAFRIFTDRALQAIVEHRPSSARELLAIPGIGISAVEKYGAHIYRILHEGK